MPPEIDNVNIETEADADALIESVMSPTPDKMVADTAQGTDQTGDQSKSDAAATKQAIQEYEIKYGGKSIKAPIDKIIRWAEQGYEAPTKIGELNKKLESYAAKEKAFQEMEQKYGPVDKYVRDNPQWFEFMQSQYQRQMEQAQQNQAAPQINQVIEPLQKQIQELMSYKDTIEKERYEARMRQEDVAYQSELESLRKSYPKVDFNSVDQSGKSLEYRVLEHATQNGINKFTTAFRDFYHDELVKAAEVEAKEKVMKDKQSRTKLGILGVSSTPTPKVSDGSVKGKSYDDLYHETLVELGLT